MNTNTQSALKALLKDKKAQGAIIWRCTAHWFIFMAGAGFVSFLVQVCINPFAGFSANVSSAFRSFLPILLTLAAFLPVFVYDYLKLSHRIFGPVYRIRDMLKNAEEHQPLEPLQVREDDTHAALVEDLNALVHMVNQYREAERIFAKAKKPAAATDAPVADPVEAEPQTAN